MLINPSSIYYIRQIFVLLDATYSHLKKGVRLKKHCFCIAIKHKRIAAEGNRFILQ